MAITSDSRYMFLGIQGKLEQYRIADHTHTSYKLINNVQSDFNICSVVTTFDCKHAFVGQENGSLTQICIESQIIIIQYQNAHKIAVKSMAVTKDNRF
jgi:hypothetical protein